MSAHERKPSVPGLRFPKFRESGEWEEKTLGAVSDMQAGKFIAASEISEKKTDGLYPCFGGNGLRGYCKTYNKSGRYSLIGRQGALCGNVNLVDGEFYATEHAVVTTPKAGVSTDWLFYNLRLLNLNRFATGQAQPGLSIEVLEKVDCLVPKDKDEQQKIADCLSSLDDLITAETKKLETVKAHKKGLMQQLFPHTGETAPRLRFTEFREAEKWILKTVGDSCESFSGGTPSTTNKSFYGGVIPFIRSAEIDQETTELFLSNEGLSNSAAKMVKIGDILVALYGANSGDVALSKVNGAINQAILCLRHETNNIFVYQYLTHKKDWIIATFIQGGQGNLSGEIIKAIRLFFPKPKEQQRIADCLSSLDDLITAQSQKIDVLKSHKKGLIQQLFPVLDEVST